MATKKARTEYRARPEIWLYDPCNLIPNYCYRLAEALGQHAQISLIARDYEYCTDLDWPDSVRRMHWPDRCSRWVVGIPTVPRALVQGIKWIEYCFGVVVMLMCLVSNPPKILHVQWDRLPALDLLVVAVARWLGVMTIITVHDVEPLYGRGGRSFWRACLLAMSDKILLHSRENIRRLKIIYPNLDPAKIEEIPFGVSLPSQYVGIREARSQLQLDPEAFVCGFIGNIKEYKGLDDFLAAAIPLLSENPRQFKVLIAGKADLAATHKYLLDLTRRYENFTYIDGYIPESNIGQLFAACDLIALPYRRVSQSGVVFQALSMAKPVLATRVGGLAEVIQDQCNGFLVEAGDVDAMRRILSRSIDHRQQLAEMGRMAFEQVSTSNTWQRSAAAHMKIYRSDRLTAKELLCEF